MKKLSLSNQNRDTLSQILHLCAPSDNAEMALDPDRQRSECLEDLLAEPLREIGPTHPALSEHLDSICELSGLDKTTTLREYLLQPTTDITILQQIRKRGKAKIRTSESPIDQELGGVLYYAAIASARVFHNEMISNLTPSELQAAFQALIDTPWMPTDLTNLFEKAIEQNDK
ncbi:hypothetical protein ACFL6U_31515 [Planctomycetota bacterium]